MDSQDRTALMEQWYRQYAPLLFHYARQFVDYHAAEEVVQETFRIAWEAIQQREVQYPKTWLRKIAENIIRNRLRQQDRSCIPPRRPAASGRPGQSSFSGSCWRNRRPH